MGGRKLQRGKPKSYKYMYVKAQPKVYKNNLKLLRDELEWGLEFVLDSDVTSFFLRFIRKKIKD